MAIYENVKKVCATKGVSIYALEERLGFPRSSICKWNTNIPSAIKVKAVADELGCTVDELLEES